MDTTSTKDRHCYPVRPWSITTAWPEVRIEHFPEQLARYMAQRFPILVTSTRATNLPTESGSRTIGLCRVTSASGEPIGMGESRFRFGRVKSRHSRVQDTNDRDVSPSLDKGRRSERWDLGGHYSKRTSGRKGAAHRRCRARTSE
jgi:hypothetical protein